VKAPASNKLVGTPLRRPKAKQLVTGRGRYTDDLRPNGLLHASFVRSQYAHAKILRIDSTQALSHPGVVRVFTAGDLLKICKPWTTQFTQVPEHRSAPQSPLANERALWQGQPVAIVIASSRAVAEDAAALVDIEWEPLPVVATGAAALAEGAPLIHSELGSNILFEKTLRGGNPEAMFREADIVIRHSMRFPRLTGVPLESRSLIADFDPTQGTLTLHASTQVPHQMRSVYAAQLGLDESRVRVIVPDVGGGFGIKLHTYDDEMAVAASSLLIGRPIKFVSDRFEAFVSDNHARAHAANAALALDKSGRFLAFSTDDVMEAGAFSSYPRSSVLEGMQAVNQVGAPYDALAFDAHLRIVFQNKPHTGSYRGVGQPVGCAVTELLVESAARALQIDPAELRRRNYRSAARSGNITLSGVDLGGELSQEACLEKLLDLMNYPQLRKEQGQARLQGRHLGIGFASFIEATATGPMFYGSSRVPIAASDGCSVRLEPGGTVSCITSAQFQGQGLEVAIAQIVGDALKLPFEAITIVHGDTAVTPMGGGSYASRGLTIAGEAAMLAAVALRQNILNAAGELLETSSADLELSEGRVTVAGTDRAVTLPEVAFAMHYCQHLMPSDASTDPMVTRHYASRRSFLVANGIQASLVEVDPDTGFVRLLKHWVVDDCGRIVNPMLADEQIRGAVVQGIGAALFEECAYDENGQMLAATMADYLVPMAADMPDIEIGHVETPVGDTLLGTKGVGEAGIVGASACVANAINDALAPFGAEIFQLPVTPERILRALGRVA
jgi:carbon-monoxide dehydrogenase large subunit